MEKRVQPLRNLGKLHSLCVEDLHQELVAVDKLSLVGVLQLVRLDVLPEGGYDDGPRLGVNSQQPGQPLVQLELEGLVIQQEEDGAPHVFIARPLHLESVGFLSRRGPVPLHKVVVGSVQLFVQLNDKRLEKGGELALGFGRVGALDVVYEPSLHSQLPARGVGPPSCDLVLFLGREGSVRNEDPQFALLLHWPLQSLLNVEPLPHDGRVKLPLERE